MIVMICIKKVCQYFFDYNNNLDIKENCNQNVCVNKFKT